MDDNKKKEKDKSEIYNHDEFFKDGLFEWQISAQDGTGQQVKRFDEEKYWGGFSREPFDAKTYELPDWAIGPFEKFAGNPVFAPSENGWDRGCNSGGVHNGSVIRKDDRFYYIYRGEQSLENGMVSENNKQFNYICDIGLAWSKDGTHFFRDDESSPFFRKGEDVIYSFEDVNLVEHDSRYYLFCNRWNWNNPTDPAECGVYLAISDDLKHWQKKGLVFPDADRIHRNPCVLQNPYNEAVKVNGKFVMYINDGLIAYSEDMLNWSSESVDQMWPGGEGCFALTDYSDADPDMILLFTGGHHTGNFYAIGEVLLSKENPQKPIDWLPRPILQTEDQYPWENGYSSRPPYRVVSSWQNTIFFTGMTLYDGKWMMYYGGSEYYTCLATAKK